MEFIRIKLDNLIRYEAVNQRLKSIIQDCSSTSDSVEPGEILKIVYPIQNIDVVMAVDAPRTLSKLESHPQSIMGFVLIVSNSTMIELWDVCVAPEHRCKGIFKGLIDEVMRSNPWTRDVRFHKAMWVGLDPHHPLLNAIIRVYARSNFGRPRLTTTTGIGAELVIPMLELRWLGIHPINEDELIENVRGLNLSP
jgi:hypothetical protein